MDAYQKVKVKEQNCKKSKEDRKLRAQSPPPTNCLKVNVDVVVHKDKQVACMFRGTHWAKCSCNSENIKFQGNISLVETQAVKQGMEVAKEASFTNVIFETDCSEVADLTNNKTSNRIEIWWTTSQIQRSKHYFQSAIVQHVPKHCNILAHSLAKRAFRSPKAVIWLDGFPANILYLLFF